MGRGPCACARDARSSSAIWGRLSNIGLEQISATTRKRIGCRQGVVEANRLYELTDVVVLQASVLPIGVKRRAPAPDDEALGAAPGSGWRRDVCRRTNRKERIATRRPHPHHRLGSFGRLLCGFQCRCDTSRLYYAEETPSAKHTSAAPRARWCFSRWFFSNCDPPRFSKPRSSLEL